MAVLSQAAFAANNALLNRPTFTQIVNGFDKFGGVTLAEAPTILRVVSDFGSITPMWDRQTNLTNFSHYIVQVSEDQSDWFSLGFSGQWYDTIDEQTIVYDNNINHTRVPHNDDGSIRTLYYRVATITKAAIQSDWSIPVSGTTVWIEQVDIRNDGNYSYVGLGSVIASGAAGVETDIPHNVIYTGSGSVYTSGSASTDIDKNYIGSGAVQTSGTASIDIDKDYLGSGVAQASGAAVTELDDGAIVFGSKYSFNSTSTTYLSTAALDSTHFVTAYSATTGKAVIGTKSGNNISYGSEYTFSTSVINTKIGIIDSTHFVLIYREGGSLKGKSVIGTVSGNTISFGNEYDFNSDLAIAYYPAVSVISPTKFIISYGDSSNNGTSTVGTISGSTISYGSKYIFSTGTAFNIDVKWIDSSHAIIAYQDSDNGGYGTSLIASVSGSSISYGNYYIHNSGKSFSNSISILDSTHYAVTYRDNSNSNYGTTKIGTMTSSFLSYGPAHVFTSSAPTGVVTATLDSTHIVASYNTGDGYAIVGTISGNVIEWGTESLFDAGGAGYFENSAMDSTNFVTTYRNSSGFGTAIIGTL